MIEDKIIDITQKVFLLMDISRFQELIPFIELSNNEKKDKTNEKQKTENNLLFGNYYFISDINISNSWHFIFKSGLLTNYEIVAQLDYNEYNYNLLKKLYINICPILNNIYFTGNIIHNFMDFHEFDKKEIPKDSYPIDRYIIGAMSQWKKDNKEILLSFSLMSPGYLFFQLRGIVI